jgi:hypothetical protein
MADYYHLYEQFVKGGNALQVFEGNHLIFSSDKPMLAPLLEYIETYAQHHEAVVVFDKILGNAAALLSVLAHCREAYSPLGSEPAIKTLNKYGIVYHITKVVPYIQKPNMSEMCPMEKLSIGKNPEEFYQVLRLGKPKGNC